MPEQRKRKKPPGRSELARKAHFRLSGALGGTRQQQARRKRRKDRLEERRVQREVAEEP